MTAIPEVGSPESGIPALAGGAAWQQALYRHLKTHAGNEAELLGAYRKAAHESRSDAFRYLATLILEEEERHHRLFCAMAQTLEAEADERHEVPVIPRLGQWGFERAQIIALTERLLGHEQDDARELQDLAEELEGLEDKTMWQLLVRLMQADTGKHIAILDFVRHHATEAGGPGASRRRQRGEPAAEFGLFVKPAGQLVGDVAG